MAILDSETTPCRRRAWRGGRPADLTARVVALVGLAVLAAVIGCTDEQTHMPLSAVPMPEGGAVPTMALVETAGETVLVAPTRAGMFIRPVAEAQWYERRTRWPAQMAGGLGRPLVSLASDREAVDFPRSQLFTAYEGRLWMLAGTPTGERRRLYVSHDVGRHWEPVPLPSQAGPAPDGADAAPADNAPSPEALRPIATRSTLRLLNQGVHGLFLVDATSVWRYEPPSQPGQPPTWPVVSTTGITFEEHDDAALPPVIRTYLPATATRPFEVLTVLGDQLYIYRRHREQDAWVLASTLPTAERALVDLPGQDSVLLLGPDGPMRSLDQVEQWERLRIPELPRGSAEAVAMRVVPGGDDDPMALLVGTDEGAIYRSVDEGTTWNEVRAPDADQRGITEFIAVDDGSRVWASTRGSGVLRSTDRGQSWTAVNNGLTATQPFVVDVGGDGRLLVGTDAGLFRLTSAPADGLWQQLHDRATTAVYSSPDGARLLSGTLSGAIVSRQADGVLETLLGAPMGEADSVFYQPPRFRGVDLPSTAVVYLGARPDTDELFAWWQNQGAMRSLDAGVSWSRLELNPAFLSALEGAVVANFTPGRDEALYLTSQPLESTAPTQLWRSYSNGETWHAVFSLPDVAEVVPPYLARSATMAERTLYLAHDRRLARSTDGGSTWSNVEGPWSRGRIQTYTITDGWHALVTTSEHATIFARAKTDDVDALTAQAYRLVWQQGHTHARSQVRDLTFRGRNVFIAGADALFFGEVPGGQQHLPDGVAIIAMITAIFLLTGVGFAVLKLAGS